MMFQKLFYAQANTKQIENLVLVPDAHLITHSKTAANIIGTCGYVAAALLADYWSKHLGSPVHPPELQSQQAIHDRLYAGQSKHSSVAWTISRAWSKNGFKARIRSRLAWFGVYRELRLGRPVVLFGGLPDVSTSKQKYINHAVLAYGYRQVGRKKTLLVHYGWRGHEQVFLKTPFQGSANFYEPENLFN